MVYFRPSQVTGLVDVSGSVNLSRLDIIAYAEATNVPASTLTTVLSYTAPALLNANIVLIKCSGQDPAKFQFFIETVLKGTIRSGGGDRNAEWNFSFPLALDSGKTIDIKVTHYFTGELLDYEVGMYAFSSAP